MSQSHTYITHLSVDHGDRRHDVRHSLSQDKTKLNPVLPGWQIFMIAIGGVIGITILSTHGEILHIAGPAGLLVATLVVATTMICTMECLGEMVVLWPVSNAMVEYVRAFVDKDLAIVIGIAYWYTFSSIFATLISVAANLSTPWITTVWRDIASLFFVPVALLIINMLGVKWYGWVEGIGGMIKVALVITGVIVLIVDAPKAKDSRDINAGFEHEIAVASNDAIAVIVSIPLLAYGYIGTEIVSVTAFEARDRKDLRFPARFVSYFIAALYASSALLECVAVNWMSPNLEDIAAQASHNNPLTIPVYPVIQIATNMYNNRGLGVFFDWCIIYFCLSASNTALYVSSRTIFGLTRGLNHQHMLPWYLRMLKPIGRTSGTRKVPHFALIISGLAFYWLIPLQQVGKYAIIDLLEIMGTTASIGGFLVWSSQCLAYLRYHHWFHTCKIRGILDDEYNRWEPRPDRFPRHHSRMTMASLSPWPAWIGLCGTCLIVFIFSTANWWSYGHPSFKAIATAYAGPVILAAIFVILKASRWIRGDGDPHYWYGFARLSCTRENLTSVINNFEKNEHFRFEDSGGIDLTELAQARADSAIGIGPEPFGLHMGNGAAVASHAPMNTMAPPPVMVHPAER